MERLNKYLASLGYGSRRKIDALIKGGNILVNGKKAGLGQKIGVKDKVYINGKEVVFKQSETEVYLLNKPKGIISTSSDEFKRKSVVDFIPTRARLFPVGRLDKNTSGLILLTNDGDLAQKLTHPKYEVEKEYIVVLNKPLNPDQIKKIKEGIEDKREKYHIDAIAPISRRQYKIILHEGKKREIRRMMAIIGADLIALKRVRIGKLRLDNLKEGKFKILATYD